MSAWLCSQDHINLIVNASDDPTDETFKLLLEENLKSLRHRYPGRDFLQDWENAAKSYQFERIAPIDLIKRVYAECDDELSRRYYSAVTQEVTLKRVRAQVRRSCASFNYQSCEHPEWETSKAHAIVRAVMNNTPKNERLENEALWSF